jgi:hypothetical protein
VSAAEDNRHPFDANLDAEPAPDSSVRPIDPCSVEAPMPPGERVLPLRIRVCPPLLGADKSAYVTLTTAEGEVLFEGFTEGEGLLDIVVVVDMATPSVHALIESGTKYRNATIAISAPGEGPMEHTFS